MLEPSRRIPNPRLLHQVIENAVVLDLLKEDVVEVITHSVVDNLLSLDITLIPASESSPTARIYDLEASTMVPSAFRIMPLPLAVASRTGIPRPTRWTGLFTWRCSRYLPSRTRIKSSG